MTRKVWKSRIKKACNEIGTYKKSFDITIDLLAGVLERYDNTLNQFVNEGSQIVQEYTNKNGSTNIVRNQLVVTLERCEDEAKAYLNELGLTSKGFKGLGGIVEKNEEDSFEKFLAELEIKRAHER